LNFEPILIFWLLSSFIPEVCKSLPYPASNPIWHNEAMPQASDPTVNEWQKNSTGKGKAIKYSQIRKGSVDLPY